MWGCLTGPAMASSGGLHLKSSKGCSCVLQSSSSSTGVCSGAGPFWEFGDNPQPETKPGEQHPLPNHEVVGVERQPVLT